MFFHPTRHGASGHVGTRASLVERCGDRGLLAGPLNAVLRAHRRFRGTSTEVVEMARSRCFAVLNQNRITQNGAVQLVEQTRGMDVEQVELMNNPISDANHILKHAHSRTSSECIVGPFWNKEIARGALSSKETWSDYFSGPAQLMRATI